MEFLLGLKALKFEIKELFRRLFGRCELCGDKRTEDFYCIDRQRDVAVCDKCFNELLNLEFFRGV